MALVVFLVALGQVKSRFLVKMLFSSVFAAAALLTAEVAAHGAVTSYVIDGKTYPG